MSVFISYIQIFASYFCGILLYFFPGIVTYRQFALIMAVLSSVFLISEISHAHGRISVVTFRTFIIGAIVIVGYRLITPAINAGAEPARYSSNFLSLLGQVFPSILTACFIAQHNDVQERIKAWAPYVALLFTAVAFVCTLRPAASTSGNLIENLNGFDYQIVSYVAAYASGLLGFYLVCKDKCSQMWIFKSKAGVPIALISMFLDLLIVLLSGGRGGFVTYILLGLVTVFFALKSSTVSPRTIIKGALVLIIVIAGGYFAVKYVSNSSLSTIGFSRIVTLISGGGDFRRAAKRTAALASFSESPIIGHGFGSVFYEIGEYTHNFFTDALVEGGIVLIIFLIVIFCAGFISNIKLIKANFTDIFWTYIFLCGFIISMFSGYYLTHFPLWWGVVFMLAKGRRSAEDKDLGVT